MSIIVSRAAPARRNHDVYETKVPRERIVTLSVAADPCPQLLIRVLGLIARHGIVPLSIAAEMRETVHYVAVDIDGVSAQMKALLAKIEAMVTVRSASVHPADGRPPLARAH